MIELRAGQCPASKTGSDATEWKSDAMMSGDPADDKQ